MVEGKYRGDGCARWVQQVRRVSTQFEENGLHEHEQDMVRFSGMQGPASSAHSQRETSGVPGFVQMSVLLEAHGVALVVKLLVKLLVKLAVKLIFTGQLHAFFHGKRPGAVTHAAGDGLSPSRLDRTLCGDVHAHPLQSTAANPSPAACACGRTWLRLRRASPYKTLLPGGVCYHIIVPMMRCPRRHHLSQGCGAHAPLGARGALFQGEARQPRSRYNVCTSVKRFLYIKLCPLSMARAGARCAASAWYAVRSGHPHEQARRLSGHGTATFRLFSIFMLCAGEVMTR